MALVYPRFVVNEFAPAFRLFDELSGVSRRGGRCGPRYQQFKAARPFNPRFDVTENKDSYELKGELPGVEQSNIEVVFTDEKTLTIKGHTESHREEGTRPTAQVESKTTEEAAKSTETEQAPIPVSDESDTSSTYHKASVEDEYVDVSGESDVTMSGANPDATPAETPKEAEKQEVAAPAKTEEKSRRWVSERSYGSFSRSFTFPRQIETEAVSASLKDGILSVVIPKAAAFENKKIEIQ